MSLESLVSAGRRVNLAALGPGPVVLVAGDSQNGYFGPVPSSELFTSSEIAQQWPGIGDIGQMVWGVDLQWLKFVINGKIVYISTVAMNGGCRWNDLYAQGFIYGTDDNGLVPAATPVNQWRPLAKTVKGVDYILTPRALRYSLNDVIPTTEPIGADALALINVIKAGYGKGTGKWASLTPADYNYNWTLNTYTNTINAMVYGISPGLSTSGKTGTIRYFPVLDLQDITKVTLPVAQVRGMLDGPVQPVVSAVASFTDSILPVDISTVTYQMSELKAPTLGIATVHDRVIAPNAITYQPYYQQPMITVKLS